MAPKTSDGTEVGGGVADDEGPAEGLGAGLEDGDGLGVAVAVDEEGGGGGLGGALGHGHGFGGGGGLVEQGGVGDVEAGEVADHGLEVEEGFETALGDFGLVGGVGGVPGGVLEDVAVDDGGDDGAVVALADERGEDLIFGGDGAEGGDGLDFGERGAEGEWPGARMEPGTVSAMSWSMDSRPMVLSMDWTSCGVGADVAGGEAGFGGDARDCDGDGVYCGHGAHLSNLSDQFLSAPLLYLCLRSLSRRRPP